MKVQKPSQYPDSPFKIIAFLAAFAAFALITIGGTVRVTDSGLGCPDWPLCHGRLIPPFEFHTLIEYSHRLSASLASMLVILTAGMALYRYRTDKSITIPAVITPLLIAVEIVIGGITVLLELPPTIVTIHLAVAYTIFALLITTNVAIWKPPPAAKSYPGLFRLAMASLIVTFVVTLSGSYTVGAGAGLVCSSWPGCDGQGILPNNILGMIHMGHRAIAGLAGILVLWVGFKALRIHEISWPTGLAGGAVVTTMVLQVIVGALIPILGLDTAPRVLHLSMATAVWGSVVTLAAISYWTTHSPYKKDATLRDSSEPHSLKDTVLDYIILTKPRIMLLLLLTALGGMILAQNGLPPLGLILVVMAGGALAAGGASALNHCFDQEVDQRMNRTKGRPVASKRIPPRDAFIFGLIINAISFMVLWLGANLISASLAMIGSAFYVLVYTKWLKRSTVQNIVIGGAAGAVPPLVGWAAVAGDLNLSAAYLFAIIFFWTPPHFWALALLLRKDYAMAGIPMLPVIEGEDWTRWCIFIYVIILNAITILFYLTTHSLGLFYLGGAIILGSIFTFYATQLLYNAERPFASRLYKYSLLYLALLFAVIMADRRL